MKAEVTPAVYLATVLILVGIMVGVYFVMLRLGSTDKKSDRSEQRNAYKEKFNFLQS
jgi:preprotein translocase subunit YajC